MTMYSLQLRVLCLILGVLLLAPRLAAAGDEPPEKTFVVRPWAYEKLKEAYDAIGKNQIKPATDALEWLERKRINDHEKALMLQARSQIHALLNNYPEAARTLEQMLALDSLPDASQLQARFNLGQLLLATGQSARAWEVFQAWYATAKNPSATALHTMAVAAAQAKKPAETIRLLQEAMPKVKRVEDSWLLLLLSQRVELRQLGEAARLLQELVVRHPEKKNYWLQLASVEEELGHPGRALAILELAHEGNLLDQPREVINLVQRLAYQGAPARAARLLEQALRTKKVPRDADTLRQLTTFWQHARERRKALGPLAELARSEPSGKESVRLAQMRMELEDWEEAVQALQQALAKGHLDHPGDALLMLGNCLLAQQKLDQARQAFSRALAHPQSEPAARRWLKYIENKVKESARAADSAGGEHERKSTPDQDPQR